MMPHWVHEVFQFMKRAIPREFIGQVEINCFKGGVTNINVKQSYKEEETTKNAST